MTAPSETSDTGLDGGQDPRPHIANARVEHVAVIVVHGVGNPPPQAAADRIAELLLRLDDERGRGIYGPVSATPLQIATRPLPVEWHAPPDQERRTPSGRADAALSTVGLLNGLRRLVEDRGARMRSHHCQAPAHGLTEPPETPDISFMKDQLQAYAQSGGDPPYSTVRLQTQRSASDGSTPVAVQLFEMYWGDLSRLGTSVGRVFGELYQVMLHASTLGQHVVHEARAADPANSAWKRFDLAQDFAVRCLCIALPILNLLLVATAVVAIPSVLSRVWVVPLAWVIGVGAGVGAAGVWFFRTGRTRVPVWVCVWGVGLALAIAGASGWLRRGAASAAGTDPGFGAYNVLALEGCAVAAVALIAVVAAYNRRRPGAGLAAMVFGLPTLSFALGRIVVAPNSPQGVASAALHTADVLWMSLFAAGWLPLFGGTLAAWACGIYAVRSVETQARARARRVAWTARLTLALPTVLFFILTMAGWALVVELGSRLLPREVGYQSLVPPRVLGHASRQAEFYNRHAIELFNYTGAMAFLMVLAMLGLALWLAAWSLWPSVLAEVRLPRGEERVRHYGEWLDTGLGLMRAAGEVLFLASLFIAVSGMLRLALYVLSSYETSPGLLKSPVFAWLTPGADAFLTGGLLTAAGVALMGLRGRLDALGLRLRPVLDAILDVDIHLRIFPRATNPKARIFARYASLLRYLEGWRSPDGRPLAGIVIIAHSQGTVITADLLRLLRAKPEMGVPPLPRLYFFTMGCPLRQLYASHFPNLYAWAWHPQVGRACDPPASIPDDQQPDPDALGVEEWVNTYRSGDYIGRYLWRPAACGYLWRVSDQHQPTPWRLPPAYAVEASTDTRGRRREFCLGAGAHTHYWDLRSPAVAHELDRLIRAAAS